MNRAARRAAEAVRPKRITERRMRPPTRADVMKALAHLAADPEFAALIPEPFLYCPACGSRHNPTLLLRVVVLAAANEGTDRVVQRGLLCSSPQCMQPIWDSEEVGEESAPP